MQWELAHQLRDAVQATQVTIEAPEDWAAVSKQCEQIPVDDVVLHVRAR